MLKQKEIFGNFLNKMIRKAAIISISGFFLTGQEINTLKKEKPWGVILFKRNISSKKQIKKLTSLIRKVMSDKLYPILIDEEGGRGHVDDLSEKLNANAVDLLRLKKRAPHLID